MPRIRKLKSGSLKKFFQNRDIILNFNEINKEIKKQKRPVFADLGFGMGESIVSGYHFSDALIIGVEKYMPCIERFLARSDSMDSNIEKIKDRIKILNSNIEDFLQQIENDSLDGVFLLFPDPWPKNRQKKRRIANEDFFEILKKKIKKNGFSVLATDHKDYLKQMKNNAIGWEVLEFIWSCDDSNLPYWLDTNYSNKAMDIFKESGYIVLRNVKYS